MSPERFKEIREQLQMTKKELAYSLRLSPKTISRYESGACEIPFSTEQMILSKELRDNKNRIVCQFEYISLERIINSYDAVTSVCVALEFSSYDIVIAVSADDSYLFFRSDSFDHCGYISGDMIIQYKREFLDDKGIQEVLETYFQTSEMSVTISGDGYERGVYCE